MKLGSQTLLLVGVIVLVLYLFMQSQNKQRGLAAARQAQLRQCQQAGFFGKLLGGLLSKGSGGGGKSGGGGSGSAPGLGSGAGAASGQKSCSRPTTGCCCTPFDPCANPGRTPTNVVGPLPCCAGCTTGVQPTTLCCCSAGACGGCAGSGCFCGG